MKRERVFYTVVTVILIWVCLAYYLSVSRYVATMEETIALQDELIEQKEETIFLQDQTIFIQQVEIEYYTNYIERMEQAMNADNKVVRTTTMTHEERVAAAGDATTQEEKVQNIADALLKKIIAERKAENEDNA